MSAPTYNLPPVMTVAEVADALMCHRDTVYEMLRGDGPLSRMAVYIGAKRTGIRVRRDDFLQWLADERAHAKGR